MQIFHFLSELRFVSFAFLFELYVKTIKNNIKYSPIFILDFV